MSDQNKPPLTTPGEEHFYQASSRQGQVAPALAIAPRAAASQPGGKALVFPLIHRVSTRLHILAMLLYSVLLIIALTSCLFALNTPPLNQPDMFLSIAQLFQGLFLVFVLAPASTLLCALFFGSWRGTLVSCISIYASIQFTHLLNNRFWSDMSLASFQFFIPVILVTFFVGLSYDLRKQVSKPASIFTMVVAAPILVFTFLLISEDPSATAAWDEGGGALCCMAIFLFPSWILLTVGIENLIQKALSQTKRKSTTRPIFKNAHRP